MSSMVLDSALTQRKPPSQTAFQISKDFLHSHAQPCWFVSLQEALSEQLGENWGFPQDTKPHLYLSYSVS